MNKLKITTLPVTSLKPDPRNAKNHKQKDLKDKAESLRTFGQQKPVVVRKDGTIVAGNGTFLAARDILGWTEIEVVFTELDDPASKAYAIADNYHTSEWDLPILADTIKEIGKENPNQNWSALGMDKDFVDPILKDDFFAFASGTNNDIIREDENLKDKPRKGKTIKFSEEQKLIIEETIALVRKLEDKPDWSENLCIELVCANFLAGHNLQDE